MLCDGGRIFSTGLNQCGQLGLGIRASSMVDLVEIKSLRGRAASAACGASHSVVVCNDGSVYGMGYNGWGQLGLGNVQVRVNEPERIPLEDTDVVQAACGEQHSLLLRRDGEVLVMGHNHFGQLGLGDTQNVSYAMRLLNFKRPVACVVCGTAHSFLLTRKRRVFCMGLNDNGQLGLGAITVPVMRPTELVFFKGEAASISCGGNHTYVVVRGGRVFGFGENQHGQLCDGPHDDIVYPQELTAFAGLVQYVVGGSDSHAFIVGMDGKVHGVGNNAHGQLCMGHAENVSGPMEVPMEGVNFITSISCGKNFTMLVEATLLVKPVVAELKREEV